MLEGKSGGHGAVAEVRNSVGNFSTPYLLIAFVAGTMCARMRTGALTGLAATMSALLGYYLVSALVQAGDSGFAGELRSILSANRGYIQGGVGTGLAFGALGAWWERRRRLSASIVAGALLMAEPFALLTLGVLGPDELAGEGVPTVLRLVPGWGLTLDRSAIPLAVYAMEFFCRPRPHHPCCVGCVRRHARGRTAARSRRLGSVARQAESAAVAHARAVGILFAPMTSCEQACDSATVTASRRGRVP